MLFTAASTVNHAAVARLETVASILDCSLATVSLAHDRPVFLLNRNAPSGRKQHRSLCTRRLLGQSSQKTLQRNVHRSVIEKRCGLSFTVPQSRPQSQQNVMIKRHGILDRKTPGWMVIYKINVAKPSPSEYTVSLPAGACRYLSTSSTPSPPARNKPVPPRPIIRPPLHDPRRVTARPKPPPVPVFGRARMQPREEESMMPGVKAMEKARELIDIQRVAQRQAWLRKYKQVISGANDLTTCLDTMRAEGAIAQQVERAVKLGGSDYYLQRCHALSRKADLTVKRVESWAGQILEIGNRRAQELFRQFERLADRRTGDIQNSLDDASVVIADLVSREDNISSYYYGKGLELMKIRRSLKNIETGYGPLWKGMAALRSTIFEILYLTENTLVPLIPEVDQSTARKIIELSDTAKQLGYPLGSSKSEFGDWRLLLSDIGHRVRELELNMRMSQTLPEITFSQRWAVSVKSRYLSPISETNTEINTLLHLYIYGKSSTNKNEQDNRHPHSFRKKFHILKTLVNDFAQQTTSLASSFERLIGSGDNFLCPHPDQALHRAQIRVHRPIERWYDGWDEVEAAMRRTKEAMRVAREHDTALDKFDFNREHLFATLSSHLRGSSSMRNILSRQGKREDQSELFIWYSINWLLHRLNPSSRVEPPDSHNIDAFCSTQGHQLSVLGRNPNSTPAPRTIPWMDHNSLYPISHSVMIDFVSSKATLCQALDELSKEQVIGLDVTSTKIPPLNIPMVEYIIMSTHSNVYILDFLVLRRKDFYKHTTDLFRGVLGNPGIIKVGIDGARLTNLLWNGGSALSLTSIYDVAHQLDSQDRTVPPKVSPSGIERYFGPDSGLSQDFMSRPSFYRDIDPIKFFHHLAMQALAPLRLFDTYHKQDVIRTTDTRVPVKMTEYHENLAQSGVPYGELGPVCVDRHRSAARRMPKGPSYDPFWRFNSTESRGQFMRHTSLNIARQYVKDTNLRLISGKSDQSIPPSAMKGIAAYFLATTFGERLNTIESYLNLANPARWIMWAQERCGLRLNAEDVVKYTSALEGQVGDETLPPSNIVFDPVRSKNATDRSKKINEKLQLGLEDKVEPSRNALDRRMRKAHTEDGSTKVSAAGDLEPRPQGMTPAVWVPIKIEKSPSASFNKSKTPAQLRNRLVKPTKVRIQGKKSQSQPPPPPQPRPQPQTQKHNVLTTTPKTASHETTATKTDALSKLIKLGEKFAEWKRARAAETPNNPEKVTVSNSVVRKTEQSSTAEPVKTGGRARPTRTPIIRKIASQTPRTGDLEREA